MAPRPYENSFRVRRPKTATSVTPAIYAVSSGPQRGVHLLNTEPLPPSIQYMYRHVITVHDSLLTLDFAPSTSPPPRRFDSIEAAQKFLDDLDATAAAGDPSPMSCTPSPASRSTEHVYGNLPETTRASGGGRLRRCEVLDGMKSDRGRVSKGGGGYSRSHTGVRRRESWTLGILGSGVLERFAGLSVNDDGKT